MKMIELNNGVLMPMEGFGVFQISDQAGCEETVLTALEVGYRLLDTASSYQNEEAVGRAIRRSGVPRDELFITTKAYIHEMGYEQTKSAFYASLRRLGVDYLDLYLIHMPFGDYYGAWHAMEELYTAGAIRAIGVSNFYGSRLLDLCYNANIVPAVNQIERHPFYQREAEIALMEQLGVRTEAWGPFAEGRKNMFAQPVLQAIAAKHQRSVAQVILRWDIQRGIVVIPKSVHRERMEENLSIWDFSLDNEDMRAIAALDTERPSMLDPLLPREVKRVYNYLQDPVVTSIESDS